MSNLEQLHTDVWTFRGVVADYWPTPPPLDALRYAVTECGEAMDAFLRLHRRGDSRNNDRPGSEDALLNELADVAMMLLTAVDHEWPVMIGPKGKENTLEHICANCSNLLLDETQSNTVRYPASFIVADIFVYPGMDLTQRLHGRLARIFDRHVATKVTPAEARRLERLAEPWGRA